MSDSVGILKYRQGYDVSVEWEIKDYFNKSNEEKLKSPEFCLCDGVYYLEMDRNSERENKHFGWISLSLYIVYPSESLNCHVECRLGIRKKDGSMYYVQNFFHRCKFRALVTIDCENFFECSKLWRAKEVLVPEGTLTVFCSLTNLDNEIIKTQTPFQAALPEGITALVEHFKDLCLSGSQSDITVRVQDQEFKAHRSILAARSPVFASMFQHQTTEKQSGVIDIIDCDPNSFKEFLLYLYSGKVEEFSSDNVFGLYKTADKYDLKELKEECTQFMVQELSLASFYDAVLLAELYNESKLLDSATEFFVKNSELILPTKEWQILLGDNPVLAKELVIKVNNASMDKPYGETSQWWEQWEGRVRIPKEIKSMKKKIHNFFSKIFPS